MWRRGARVEVQLSGENLGNHVLRRGEDILVRGKTASRLGHGDSVYSSIDFAAPAGMHEHPPQA
jgi:hypothetical protein